VGEAEMTHSLDSHDLKPETPFSIFLQ
jgi:hypothetical protein